MTPPNYYSTAKRPSRWRQEAVPPNFKTHPTQRTVSLPPWQPSSQHLPPNVNNENNVFIFMGYWQISTESVKKRNEPEIYTDISIACSGMAPLHLHFTGKRWVAHLVIDCFWLYSHRKMTSPTMKLIASNHFGHKEITSAVPVTSWWPFWLQGGKPPLRTSLWQLWEHLRPFCEYMPPVSDHPFWVVAKWLKALLWLR